MRQRSVLGLGLTYLGLQVLFLPPSNYDRMTYNLARVLLFQQEKTLYLRDVTTVRQSIFPLGSDILFHAFLRNGQDRGIAIFSLLAYLAVGSGVYSVSRTFGKREYAFTAAIVVLGMQELVFQATTTKNDIIMVAVALGTILLLVRLAVTPRVSDVVFLLLLGAFGVSVKTTWLLFAAPLVLFHATVLFRRDLRRPVVAAARQHPVRAAGVVVACMVLAQPWLFVLNHQQWGGWLGSAQFSALNRQDDGLIGGIANVLRYALQTIDVLPAVNNLLHDLSGASVTDHLQSIYNARLLPLFGTAALNDLAGPFRVGCRSAEDFTWYGPLGFLLAIPSLLWCASRLRSGPATARIAWSLFGYLAVFCLLMNWTPWNNRYLSCIFAISGVCIALMLQDLGVKGPGLALIRGSSLLFFLYACIFNELKPLYAVAGTQVTTRDLRPSLWVGGFLKYGIWAETDWGANRLFYADDHFGGPRVAEFGKHVPAGATVGLVTSTDSWVYHYLLHYPSVRFVSLRYPPTASPAAVIDFILGIDITPNETEFGPAETLWTAETGTIPGGLIRLVRER